MSSALCQCGCGEPVSLAPRSDAAKGWLKGEPLKFIRGHSVRGRSLPSAWKWQICPNCGERFHNAPRKYCSRDCARAARSGRGNHAFNGGLSDTDGRCYIVCRDGSQVAFARAVVEADLGRHLTATEIVHHRNGNFADDRRSNLAVTNRSEHIEIHRPEWEERRKAAAIRAHSGQTRPPEVRARISASMKAYKAAQGVPA